MLYYHVLVSYPDRHPDAILYRQYKMKWHPSDGLGTRLTIFHNNHSGTIDHFFHCCDVIYSSADDASPSEKGQQDWVGNARLNHNIGLLFAHDFYTCTYVRTYPLVHEKELCTLNWEIFVTNNIRDFHKLTSLANFFVANIPAHVPKYTDIDNVW